MSVPRTTLVVLVALIACAQLCAALPKGYWCERTVGKRGKEIGHRGKCGLKSTCENPGFIIYSVCNNLPDDQVCCMRTPPEPAVSWTPSTQGTTARSTELSEEELSCCMRYENFRFSDAQAKKYIQPMRDAMKVGEIDSPNEIASWLAQVGAESGSLRWWLEIGSEFCPNYDGGCTYKGRGPIQLTHKYNYIKAGKWLKSIGKTPSATTIVDKPSLVEGAELGLLTSIWFWRRSNLNKYADGTYKQFFLQSRKINGGLRGINHRTSRFKHCAKCLGGKPNTEPVVPGGVQEGHVPPGGSGATPGLGKVDTTGCDALRGTCLSRTQCNTKYATRVSKKCMGLAADIKCCVPKCHSDLGGTCLEPSKCGGKTVSGACPGRNSICCVKDDTSSSTSTSTTDTSDRGTSTSGTTTTTTEPSTQPSQPVQSQPVVDTSRCDRIGGKCVKASNCGGFAAATIGGLCKGLPNDVRCCTTRCVKESFGQCRGENDCSGGRQVSRQCPGRGTKCCIRQSAQMTMMDLLLSSKTSTSMAATARAFAIPTPSELSMPRSLTGRPNAIGSFDTRGSTGPLYNRPNNRFDIPHGLLQAAAHFLTFRRFVSQEVNQAEMEVAVGRVPTQAFYKLVDDGCNGATGAVATHYDFWTNRFVGDASHLENEVVGRYVVSRHEDPAQLLRACELLKNQGHRDAQEAFSSPKYLKILHEMHSNPYGENRRSSSNNNAMTSGFTRT